MNPHAQLAHDAAAAVVLVAACLSLTTRLLPPRLVRSIAVGGIALGLAWSWFSYQPPYDFKRFWQVGHDLAAGRDYYALDPRAGRQMILNPPTVLPLFRLWANLPVREACRYWVALNSVAILALIPLAQSAQRARMSPRPPRLPGEVVLILSAALILSPGHVMGLALGQVSLWAALAILAALAAQGRGRPILAGICLAAATAKVHTLLPFLLLFHRWRDWPAWASFGLSCLLLCAMSGDLAGLPARCLKTLEVIAETHEPGKVNDYAFEGPSHASLVGLDHALYRLGLRDRDAIRSAQLGALAALAAVLAWLLARGRIPPGLDCALVALFSAIFLYHRTYDLLILALPLAFAALAAQTAAPKIRRRLAALAVVALLAMQVSADGLLAVEEWSFAQAPALAATAQALILPIATALVVAGLVGGIILLRHNEGAAGNLARSPGPH
jgi:hypothetical protein